MKMKENNKKRIIIFFCLVGAVFFSIFSYKSIMYVKDYELYKNLKEVALDFADTVYDSSTNDVTGEDNSEPCEFYPDIQPNWNYLLNLNPDICAWIYMAPDISYPVTWCGDNSFYLNHSYNKEASYAGCIFMNGQNHPDFNDRNTILYGHNMRNLSMFGKLRYYKQNDYVISYPYFYIFLPDNTYWTYEIFNVIVCAEGTSPYNITMVSDNDMHEYINNLPSIQKNIINSSDSIITLSTCTGVNSAQRLIVQGVRLCKNDVLDIKDE